MPQIRVELLGDRELVEKLKRLGDEVAGPILAEAAEKGAEIVRAAASGKARRRTGTLAQNIGTEVTSSAGNLAEVSVGPLKKAFYGMFLERGTIKMAARPFLRPALDENEEAVKHEVGDRVKEAIRRVAGD
jgi:HK97 gp10 family phage protein